MSLVESTQFWGSYIPLLFATMGFTTICVGFVFGLMKRQPTAFLTGKPQWIKLIDKVTLTRDTYRFRFQFAENHSLFGLPIGQHIRIYAPNRQGKKKGEWNGKPDHEADLQEISRPYTPTSPEESTFDVVDLVVKIYKPNQDFIDGGKLSAHMDQLQLHDRIKITGPVGRVTWFGRGVVKIVDQQITEIKQVAMIAGGSGITPMLQVLHKSFSDPGDDTKFWLVYANKTPEDIIEQNFLEELEEMFPDRFKLWYVVDQVPTDSLIKKWTYSTGYVNEQILRDRLQEPSKDSIVFACGPRPMISGVVQPALKKLGWSPERVIFF